MIVKPFVEPDCKTKSLYCSTMEAFLQSESVDLLLLLDGVARASDTFATKAMTSSLCLTGRPVLMKLLVHPEGSEIKNISQALTAS